MSGVKLGAALGHGIDFEQVQHKVSSTASIAAASSLAEPVVGPALPPARTHRLDSRHNQSPRGDRLRDHDRPQKQTASAWGGIRVGVGLSFARFLRMMGSGAGNQQVRPPNSGPSRYRPRSLVLLHAPDPHPLNTESV